MSLKITLIGAGSVVFAKNLLGDILRMPELSHATICLMDIDQDRLKVAEIMTSRMISVLKVKARVVATLDQRAAVKDANYVICTVQVGGYKPGTVTDFEIPRKYGLLQTIGDTLGVGGVFRGLRTIPVLVDLARDIADVGAPDCLLLNYANPMAMNCTAVARATGIPHIGLCHSVQGTSRQLATYAGLPYEDITYLVGGINHMAFFLKYEYRGQDAYPLLFDLLNKPSFRQDLVRFEMMRRTGYFVTESSEHQSEYVPYFIHHGKKVIDAFEVPIDEYLRRCQSGFETWEKTEAELLGKDGSILLNPVSNEYGAAIIHACETNTPRVVYGNVPNTNLIDNLPREACVELPCLVDAQGVQPTRIGFLPPQLAALCQTNINVQTLTVEAALTLKREHIYHAVMLDPHTATVLPLDKIWAMCDELIEAHQKNGLLGKFAGTIPGTGRAYAGTADRVIAEVKPVPPQNGHINAEIVFKNPRAKSYDVEAEVTCTQLDETETTIPPIRLKVRVPAGKTIAKKVTFPHAGDLPEGHAIRLSTTTPEILALDCVSPRRQTFEINPDLDTNFNLQLAGFPAVEARMRREGNALALHVAVDDTKITPRDRPWEGSSIEVFFSDFEGTEIHQYFFVPQAGGRRVKVLDRRMKHAPAIPARIRPHAKGGGYELDVKIPFASAGIKPRQKDFLFDMIVHLSALGDAHGGGGTSLSGGFDSASDSTRFARWQLV